MAGPPGPPLMRGGSNTGRTSCGYLPAVCREPVFCLIAARASEIGKNRQKPLSTLARITLEARLARCRSRFPSQGDDGGACLIDPSVGDPLVLFRSRVESKAGRTPLPCIALGTPAGRDPLRVHPPPYLV